MSGVYLAILFVHKFVVFCLYFRYELFKPGNYDKGKKGGGSREPLLFKDDDPLFYLSSFQIPFRETSRCLRQRDFSHLSCLQRNIHMGFQHHVFCSDGMAEFQPFRAEHLMAQPQPGRQRLRRL